MPKIEILARSWDQPAKGGYLHHATGDVVSVSDAEATRLIKAGAAKATKRKVTKATAPEETPAEEPQETTEDAPATTDEDTPTEETPTPLPKPKAVATTEEWQAYAISQGMDAATANASSRNELRELYADE